MQGDEGGACYRAWQGERSQPQEERSREAAGGDHDDNQDDNNDHDDGDDNGQNDDENLTQSSFQVAEAETVAVRGELKTALKRVEDLQSAISGELDSENSDNVSPPDDVGGGGDYNAEI